MSDLPVVAWRLDQAHIAIPVDLRVYGLDAVLRAAYKFTDRAYLLLERSSETEHEVIVFVVGRSASTDVSSVALEFKNELLDQQLRCTLEAQFRDVRSLIVAQAFSEGNLLDPDGDNGDHISDSHRAGRNR